MATIAGNTTGAATGPAQQQPTSFAASGDREQSQTQQQLDVGGQIKPTSTDAAATSAYADPFWDVPRIPRHLGSRILDTMEGTLWRPACDVYEVGSDIVIHVDVPGVPKEDIQIDTNDIDEIQIHGEAKRFDEFQAASSRVRERNIGRFRKVIRLPPGCLLTNITARYKDGLLEVRVPKGDNYRRIDVS
ncbi:hypothetical protein GGF31_003619 [Allomyces arbusculus]|nr:hypothetical protein GGF31_003619 [Allomyces arbusculus]